MQTTTPIFIIGSGRSGTRMLYKLFSGIEKVEVFHEYLCTHLQPTASKYFMGITSKKDTKIELMKLHGSAIQYSDSQYWIDCSNKLSWIIEPLYELFPNAKFIHVIRDGRKVVSSFFHKLAIEIYDDESTKILTNWLANPKKQLEPPPEKKYWWNIPQKGQPFYKEFPSFNQFQRICYHWTEVNRVIQESFNKLPQHSYRVCKLEELTTDKKSLQAFFSFIGLPFDEEYYDFVQTPQGVFFPMDMKMTEEEQQQFETICGKTMKQLGYTEKETYTVKY
jgi:hypothetical protein